MNQSATPTQRITYNISCDSRKQRRTRSTMHSKYSKNMPIATARNQRPSKKTTESCYDGKQARNGNLHQSRMDLLRSSKLAQIQLPSNSRRTLKRILLLTFREYNCTLDHAPK